ncbi:MULTISPECIES: hypothetical protein [Streptomyces]|uniref:Spore-associated protein n=1 Tax=Streptomyces flavovirens TaxID=52258 RepID=A0ABV8NCC6_9ACTN|nr:hypothetical protein [Streptomyces sp. MBT51]MBK3597044.1 hypothetical protein [Streptomyces sp. MBT51]
MNLKRISTNRTLGAAPAVIALTAALLAPTSAAAHSVAPPTGACPGQRVGTYTLTSSAHIEVYFSPAHGGTNCVKTVSEKTSTRYLHVWATVLGASKINSDEGLYRSYAGPVTFTGTAGRCISVVAKASPGTNPAQNAKRSLDAKHCG